ncbi:MAG: TIGR00303 family protein [Cyanobacteriota bacterium]|nr:TIGR00303 family protein [Cyanobacteriota bacterium]
MTPLRRLAGEAGAAAAWEAQWRRHWPDCQVLLLLAATDTAAIPGISAAGSTPESRRRTAAADAELLLLGPGAERPHTLPLLPAGVSPALIAHVVLRELALTPLVVDLGCPVAPAVPHLRLGPPAGDGPASCLSGGAAMAPARVSRLLALGRLWGQDLARRMPGRPLLLAECVPGGTSTALAVLRGLGVPADGLVSGSLRQPAHGLKAALVERGLAAGPRGPEAVLAAVGDPMQPLAAGLVLGAAAAGVPTILAGGSQMAAVLALALALAPSAAQRSAVAAAAAVATTAWVAEEPGSDLALLLARIGAGFGVSPLAWAADLRFSGAVHPALADYERGFVKEGVGAGGLALLWQLSGRPASALAAACDRACRILHGIGVAPSHLPSADG